MLVGFSLLMRSRLRSRVQYPLVPFQNYMSELESLPDDFFRIDSTTNMITYDKGVLTSGCQSVAILKVGELFWVIYSHSRSGITRKTTDNGVAVACKFESIPSLASLLRLNLGSGSVNVVTICPVVFPEEFTPHVGVDYSNASISRQCQGGVEKRGS